MTTICIHCGHPISDEGVYLDPSEDHDVTGAERPRCSDTACVSSKSDNDDWTNNAGTVTYREDGSAVVRRYEVTEIKHHPVSILWVGFLAGAGAFGADSPAVALAQAMPVDDADPIPCILAAIRSAVTAAGAARDPEWQPAGFEATFFAGGGLAVRFGTGRTQMNFYTDPAGQKPKIWANVREGVETEEARAAQESVTKRMSVAKAAVDSEPARREAARVEAWTRPLTAEDIAAADAERMRVFQAVAAGQK